MHRFDVLIGLLDDLTRAALNTGNSEQACQRDDIAQVIADLLLEMGEEDSSNDFAAWACVKTHGAESGDRYVIGSKEWRPQTSFRSVFFKAWRPYEFLEINHIYMLDERNA